MHKCAVCLIVFDANRDLESHAKDSGHSAFFCSCNKSYNRLCSLIRHINGEAGVKVFACEWCDEKTFSRLDKLRDHWKTFHKFGQRALDKMKNQGCQHNDLFNPLSVHDNSPTRSGSSFSSYHSAPPSFESDPPSHEQVPNLHAYMQNPARTGLGDLMSATAAFAVSPSTRYT